MISVKDIVVDDILAQVHGEVVYSDTVRLSSAWGNLMLAVELSTELSMYDAVRFDLWRKYVK